MKLEFVRILEMQRELLRIPRGMRRFREYLRLMLSDEQNDVKLPPLVAVNSMAREHVADLLDMDAESAATVALKQAAASVADIPGEFKLSVVIVDDAMGGWTNRYDYEFKLWFFSPGYEDRPRAGCGWLLATLRSSAPAALQTVREVVLTAVYRATYVEQHGTARSLRAQLAQEGCVMALAGCTQPVLDAGDLAYTREVIAPFQESGDMRTSIECLFDDTAARSLGFTPGGLSDRAGLAQAPHDARLSVA